MSKSNDALRGIKWVPNGILEESKVSELISTAHSRYLLVLERLDRLIEEAREFCDHERKPPEKEP